MLCMYLKLLCIIKYMDLLFLQSSIMVFEGVFKRCYDACIGLLDSIELKMK